MVNLKYKKYLDEKIADCHGKTIVITGANSGIGFYAARALAYKGARIVMACRSQKRAEEARLAILEAIPDAQIDILNIDQASLASIDRFAEELPTKYPQIAGFVFNAGIFHPTKKAITQEGYPLTMGTNYLGTFYLFEKLLSYFGTMKNLNVVCVGSLANRRYKYEKIEHYFSSMKTSLYRQYALSKKFMMANHCFFMKQSDANIHCSMMHPGISSTNIVSGTSNSFPRWFSRIARSFMSSLMNHPEKASLGIAILSANEKQHGNYLVPKGLFGIAGYPVTRKVPKRLLQNADVIHQKTRLFFEQKGKL